ncbi:MAG: phenylalanine--tRNA ligase subunit beta [Candidatus Hadarchaeales archaeon]
MPQITVGYRDLCRLLGRRLSVEKLCKHLLLMGIEAEAVGDQLVLDISHNRPDLLSPEGIARALKGFLGIETGMPEYRVTPSKVIVEVDRSVFGIRPFIAAGVVEDVKLSNDIVASLMQVQEKLHTSFCRNRRKASIGVYDLDTTTETIRYTSVSPDGISFVPLDFAEPLTPAEILQQHPKGIAYSKLLQGLPRYPILIDSQGKVLSMPPIVNSEDTRVRPETRRLFIDVTGTDEKIVNRALVLVMTSLAERGFSLKSVKVKYPGKVRRTPTFESARHTVDILRANRYIGISLTGKEMAEILERMRHKVLGREGGRLKVLSPPYRFDILHEVDLIEDIAIGYGYDRLEPKIPKVVTTGERHPVERLSDVVREIMIGLGFSEVLTYTLTNQSSNFEMMMTSGEAVEISNPVSGEYTILRTSLIPSLLAALRENRRNPLPQKIFEVGDVVLLDDSVETGARNVRRVGGAMIGEGLGFARIKAVVNALLRELGVVSEMRGCSHPSFIEGRAAEIIVGGRVRGILGEIHPQVIVNFELSDPVSAFEIDLE